MPDLGRHETEWAIESAWYYAIRNYSDYGLALNYYIGEFSASVEIDAPYCKIVCTRGEPSNSLAADSIEIATVEIAIGVRKLTSYGLGSATYCNVIFGGVRQLFFNSSLATYLESGMASRGGITTTTVEPLKVYNSLYQTSSISYVNENDKLDHIRVATVQTVVGPS